MERKTAEIMDVVKQDRQRVGVTEAAGDRIRCSSHPDADL